MRRTVVVALVSAGLAADEGEARRLVELGRVLVAGAPVLSPGRMVAPHEAIVVTMPRRFVSRGGDKLAFALEALSIDVEARLALDAGASTGGFTDCLLAHGAARVLAVDVGHAQLHERLRADARVVSAEGVNLRDLDRGAVVAALGGEPTIVVADLSFTSLASHVAHLVALGAAAATVVVLVKPQFETDHLTASRAKGVISDPEVWRAALVACASALQASGAGIIGVVPSPIRGAAGNVEFLCAAGRGARAVDDDDLKRCIDAAVTAAEAT